MCQWVGGGRGGVECVIVPACSSGGFPVFSQQLLLAPLCSGGICHGSFACGWALSGRIGLGVWSLGVLVVCHYWAGRSPAGLASECGHWGFGSVPMGGRGGAVERVIVPARSYVDFPLFSQQLLLAPLCPCATSHGSFACGWALSGRIDVKCGRDLVKHRWKKTGGDLESATAKRSNKRKGLEQLRPKTATLHPRSYAHMLRR